MNDRAEFLAARKAGLGGSDAAPALGLSPWKSPLQLYIEKTEGVDTIEDNERMLWGRVLEPAIREEYARRTGRAVRPSVFVVAPAMPFMLANLDGIADDGRVIEIKTARSEDGWGEAGTDDVPQTYLLQCQHYMAVTGAQLADLAVLIGGSDFRIYSIPRNTELIDLLIAGERQFWQCVQSRTPPEPTTLAEINLRWRQSQTRSVDLPPNVAAACTRLREIRDGITEAEKEAEACEAVIKYEMRDADTGLIDGVPAVTWKQSKPTHVFDAKAFKAARPDLAAEYEVERPGTRRFLLKI